MSDGRTSAVMALERRKELASELASQTPKMWTSELLGVNELDSATASQFDIAASQQPISRFMNEHIEAYCRMRDFRYLRRSRRWLYCRAAQTALDSDYEVVANYARQNLNTDLQSVFAADPEASKDVPFEQQMAITQSPI